MRAIVCLSYVCLNFSMIGIKIIVLLQSIIWIDCFNRELTCPQSPINCKCYEESFTIRIPQPHNFTRCDGMGLSKIPTTLPLNTATLFLLDTSVSRIPPGLPTSIKVFEIKGSNLAMSADDYANIPTSVEDLYLINGKISNFSLTYLDHIPNLKLLNLAGNPLNSLDIPSASPIRLSKLYLDNLKWTSLDTTKYELSDMRWLYARNGKIETVNFNFNKPNNNFITIVLENNAISSFDAKKVNINALDELDLSENPIQDLDFSSGVDYLRTLRLRKINLTVFDGSKFYLPRLEELELSENPIENVYLNGLNITKFIFQKVGLSCFDDQQERLSNIYDLDLKDNNLKSLHLTQGNINSLNIRGNSGITRLKLHSMPRFFFADSESLPCDCCLLKLFSKEDDGGSYKAMDCRNSKKYGSNVTLMAKAISCDLNKSKNDICDSVSPMPTCDSVFKVRPTTPPPPATTEMKMTTTSTTSAGKFNCINAVKPHYNKYALERRFLYSGQRFEESINNFLSNLSF